MSTPEGGIGPAVADVVSGGVWRFHLNPCPTSSYSLNCFKGIKGVVGVWTVAHLEVQGNYQREKAFDVAMMGSKAPARIEL